MGNAFALTSPALIIGRVIGEDHLGRIVRGTVEETLNAMQRPRFFIALGSLPRKRQCRLKPYRGPTIL